MIILMETASGANLFIMRSYVNALLALGHKVIFWDESQRSCFDIFHEVEAQFGPIDVYYGHSWKLNKAVISNLLARPYIQVLMRANHWGDLDDSINKEQYPVGIASDTEKKLMEELTKHPTFKNVTCQYSQYQMEVNNTHNRWKNIGLTPHGILLCADVIDYFYTEPSGEYHNDIVWAGGYWPYKSKYLSWMYGLCYPNTHFKVKIFGNGWSTPSCVGNASEHTLRNLYTNSLICPNLFEPHSLEQYSDLNQRLYQTSICGGFQIAQRAIGIEEVFPNNEIIIIDNQQEFYDHAVYFIQKPEERIPYIKSAVEWVYKSHTNFHRAAEVLTLLGYHDEALKSLDLAHEAWDRVKERVNAR